MVSHTGVTSGAAASAAIDSQPFERTTSRKVASFIRADVSRHINETATARHDAFAGREIQDGIRRTAGDVAGPPFLQEKATPPALRQARAASRVPSRYAAGHVTAPAASVHRINPRLPYAAWDAHGRSAHDQSPRCGHLPHAGNVQLYGRYYWQSGQKVPSASLRADAAPVN